MILNNPAVMTAAIATRKTRRGRMRQTLVIETGLYSPHATDDAETSASFRKLVSDLRTRRHGFTNVEAVEIRGPNWRGWVG